MHPYLQTDNNDINKAYRMALSTLFCNIIPSKHGKPDEEVITAGLEYPAPWTRDASINVWNAAGLLYPEISRRTLLGLIDENNIIGGYAGQNWDNIIWATAAWYQYLCTGDRVFLKKAYDSVKTTLSFFENSKFDSKFNLFSGPACYGDGVAAYGDKYAEHGTSAIIESKYVDRLFTLSTNCLFYSAYKIADMAAGVLSLPEQYFEKANRLKYSINKNFWSEEKQRYIYYIDDDGVSNHYETLGTAFAILFEVADEKQIKACLESKYCSAHGVPCVWPSFKRYADLGENFFGRHSGTVWPFIQGFWADAAARNGRTDLFDAELAMQTENALNSNGFFEIYNPVTGEPYGGLQEDNGSIISWRSMPSQTWSATAYLRNIYTDIFGLTFTESGISFKPCGSSLVSEARLTGLKYRGSQIDISLKGSGTLKECRINGEKSEAFISSECKGHTSVEMFLE